MKKGSSARNISFVDQEREEEISQLLNNIADKPVIKLTDNGED